jgi:sulfur relay (sulfurtransferase) complex TusBCD TusD component (DsrE family)
MRFLLVVSTMERTEYALKLAQVSMDYGNEVFIFLNEEAVNLLKEEKFEAKAKLLICRTSFMDCGLDPDLISSNARMSSLGELVELVEEADRTVFLG